MGDGLEIPFNILFQEPKKMIFSSASKRIRTSETARELQARNHFHSKFGVFINLSNGCARESLCNLRQLPYLRKIKELYVFSAGVPTANCNSLYFFQFPHRFWYTPSEIRLRKPIKSLEFGNPRVTTPANSISKDKCEPSQTFGVFIHL